MNEVREYFELWRKDYNTERPHKSLGYQSPEKFVEQWRKAQNMRRSFIRKRRTKIIHKLKKAESGNTAFI